MVDALVARLPARRTIRLNSARVDAITGPTGRFVVETSAGDAIEARAVVLATPAFVDGALLRERDAELARLCGEIPYASTATVALAFERDARSGIR